MNTKKLPNKCDYCGLKQIYPPDTGTLFTDLGALHKKGIIKQSFPRKMYEGDGNNRDEFCIISNPAWKDINTPCEEWLLAHPELSKSDYLSLSVSRESIKSSKSTEIMTDKIKTMTKWMLWATIFSAIAAGLSTYLAIDGKINKDGQEQTKSTTLKTNTTKSLQPK